MSLTTLNTLTSANRAQLFSAMLRLVAAGKLTVEDAVAQYPRVMFLAGGR